MALAALVFLYRLVRSDLPEIGRSLAQTHWLQLLSATLIAMVAYLVQALYHVGVLASMHDRRIQLRPALNIYLQSQVIRYLPGRIWGMVYQSGRMASTFRPAEIVIANFWQMLMTDVVSAGVIVSLLLSHHFSATWLLLIVPVLCLAEWLHRHPGLATWLLGKLRRDAQDGTTLKPIRWRGTALLTLEWGLYLLVFVVVLNGKVGFAQAIPLGAWYSGASLLALAAFIVPGGLAVREAIFVGVPVIDGADPVLLAVAATLLRGVFLLAELLAAAVATLLPGDNGNAQ